jgi:trehalose/maltose transport system substrate-binding protein
MVERARTGAATLALLAVTLGSVAGCGGGDSGPPTLNWYINPDNGGQARLAAACTQAADGRYRIETSVLPLDASQQREQLVRRLAAKDSALDLMSLDPPFLAEAANAGFLRAFTGTEAEQYVGDVFAPVVESARWDGRLYGAPFWANTQLLWYRKSVAQKAGVDPSAGGFTWDQLIDAAVRTGTTVGEQGRRYEGYLVWINALISSAGGRILSRPELGSDASIDIDGPAGREAARIIGKLARSTAASPTLATDGEEEARSQFNGSRGGFMLNWGYIWRAQNEDAETGVIDKSIPGDMAWARYPRVAPGLPSTPPLGGIHLAVGAYSEHPQQALDAIRCIVTPENQRGYMLDSGNPAARSTIYDDPEVIRQFPMARLIRDSIQAAAPRPITPYYTDVSSAVQSKWHPPASVDPRTTPRSADEFIPDVLRDKVLL